MIYGDIQQVSVQLQISKLKGYLAKMHTHKNRWKDYYQISDNHTSCKYSSHNSWHKYGLAVTAFFMYACVFACMCLCTWIWVNMHGCYLEFFQAETETYTAGKRTAQEMFQCAINAPPNPFNWPLVLIVTLTLGRGIPNLESETPFYEALPFIKVIQSDSFESDWRHNLTSDCGPPDLGHGNLDSVSDLSSHYVLPI